MGSKKKGLLLILDGLGDRGIAAFDGRTPLEAAETPNMDGLIRLGQGALVDPLYPGVPVGTHTGTGVLLGIPPVEIASLARGPIEAAGTGLSADPGDLLIRCNFATLEADGEQMRIIDRRAGRINEHTAELARELEEVEVGDGILATLIPATQHRAVLRLSGKNLSAAVSDTDPGSRLQPLLVTPCQPLAQDDAAGKTASAINRFTAISHERLNTHPINVQRRNEGLLPANGVICRSAGMLGQPTSLINHLGISAGLVAGESTVLGLGRVLGYRVVTDPRFTSMPDTDLQAKVVAAKSMLEQQDMVFLHVKGPDICAHDYDPQAKKALLEAVDQALAGILSSDLVVGVTGDHSTDSNSGRHVGDPVPSLLFSPDGRRDRCDRFGEADCAGGGLGRVSATGYLFAMLDAMGFVRNFKAADTLFFSPIR